MINTLLSAIRAFNELLAAGIAITAFSLLLYALTFNLRDRVARSFAIILLCVVIVFVGDALGSSASRTAEMEFWFRFQWLGIIFLPAATMHFSDALLETTGRPSRGRRRRLVTLTYLIGLVFLSTLPLGWLVGPLIVDSTPAPHLQRTWLTWVFNGYFLLIIGLSWYNFWRAYQRTLTRTGRRRMRYLLIGAIAPPLGSYPFLLFGSGYATRHPLLFWIAATTGNLAVSLLLVLMAYAVAFFGVSWPDRVVKRRLFKWLMRGPVTAITVLAITTSARRIGEALSFTHPATTPVLMVVSVLILEHLITLLAPLWERWLFQGGDGADVRLIQSMEERLLTSADLRQFLEAVLAAVCDRLQVANAFIVGLANGGLEMLLTVGERDPFGDRNHSQELLQVFARERFQESTQNPRQMFFSWGDYWLVPLFSERERKLLGFLGAARHPERPLEEEQVDALILLANRAATAMQDRLLQQEVFSSMEALQPQIELIQQLRAAARYDGTELLTTPDLSQEYPHLSKWVKDALTHYWGGPKLSESPLLGLKIVQKALQVHEGNPTNALRAILRQAIERVRPEGERRFTAEWILYNILDMKFIEGRKVREVALRLAMSEADLYRKQRVAIEAVAKAILEMEQQAQQEKANITEEVSLTSQPLSHP